MNGDKTAGARQPKTLGAILYEWFEPLDLYGPLEMFGALAPDLRIVTVADERGNVASYPRVQTYAEYGFAQCPDLDFILLPGGPGTVFQMENRALMDFLRERAGSAEVIMSVCSGSAILAKAGLLDYRRATTHKMYFGYLAGLSGNDKVEWVEEARWVEDWPYVTSSGVSAGIDMALAVIARLYGRERAERISVMTEYSWNAEPCLDPFHAYINLGDPDQLPPY